MALEVKSRYYYDGNGITSLGDSTIILWWWWKLSLVDKWALAPRVDCLRHVAVILSSVSLCLQKQCCWGLRCKQSPGCIPIYLFCVGVLLLLYKLWDDLEFSQDPFFLVGDRSEKIANQAATLRRLYWYGFDFEMWVFVRRVWAADSQPPSLAKALEHRWSDCLSVLGRPEKL